MKIVEPLGLDTFGELNICAMIAPLAPLSAGPLLSAALFKIARSPSGRLAVGYHLVPRCGCSLRLSRARGPRPLGAALFVDRLVAGGTVGETLPISIDRTLDTRPIIVRALQLAERQIVGSQLDLWA